MLEALQSALFSKYPKTDLKGLFISTFDPNGSLISSNGVLEADKPLDQLLELLYHGIIEKEQNIKTMILDIVTSVREEKNMQELAQLSPKQYGISLASQQDPSKSGILLPDTKGVETIKQALLLIKQKHTLEGKVSIYTFTTERLTVWL